MTEKREILSLYTGAKDHFMVGQDWFTDYTIVPTARISSIIETGNGYYEIYGELRLVSDNGVVYSENEQLLAKIKTNTYQISYKIN